MFRAALIAAPFFFLFCPFGPTFAATTPLGPIEELSVLDDFATNSQPLWKTSAGANIDYHTEFGRPIPGVVDSAIKLDFTRKDPHQSAPGQNWFAMLRALKPGTIGSEADGLRLLLGSTAGGEWWINISLQVGKETFSHAIQPVLPPRTTTEHVIPWTEFRHEGQSLTREKVIDASGIGVDLGANGPSLYFEKITTYRQQVYSSWLSVESSHASNNVFEAGQSVIMTLKTGGTLPKTAKAVRYEAQDFFEKVTTSGKLPLDSSGTYTLDLTPKIPGYYEIRAYWIDAAGLDIENRSCLLAEGTMPPGLATFAVMPNTASQNIERFKALKSQAFFGLHGDFMGLADLMGLCWRLDYTRWPFLEPNRPDRSQGMAAWATAIINHEPPRPDYQPAILPLCGNFGPPEWAKNKKATATPYANWNDYLAMVRDYVIVKKHLYPHMNPRIYGVAWEVNLNMPPDNFWPPYTPNDIVELHRRTRETIKSLDPQALVIGPCPSNLNPAWFEQVFKAGLLDYVDGIESHGYSEGTFSPEENDYPEKLLALKELMRRYHHGTVLPIYITEAAFRGMLGSKIIYRTQAQVMTRLAIILKGEGVRTFLPFYGIDYDRDGWWGFCFNREVDGNPWGTQRISPKPTVNAMATSASVLEGTTPVRRVHALGDDVWAYLFDRQGTFILALWNPKRQTQIRVPVGKTSEIQVTDIMGHTSRIHATEKGLDLTIDASPKYLIGVEDLR